MKKIHGEALLQVRKGLKQRQQYVAQLFHSREVSGFLLDCCRVKPTLEVSGGRACPDEVQQARLTPNNSPRLRMTSRSSGKVSMWWSPAPAEGTKDAGF